MVARNSIGIFGPMQAFDLNRSKEIESVNEANKSKPNPYESPRLESESGSIKITSDFRNSECPICGEPFSRLKVLNTISSKTCDGCGTKLWLVLPLRHFCVLGLLGLASLLPFYWLTAFPAPGSQFFLFQVVIIPFLMLFISFALRFRFGKIVTSGQSTRRLS